jgi:hypothetical protein
VPSLQESRSAQVIEHLRKSTSLGLQEMRRAQAIERTDQMAPLLRRELQDAM